jgi:hypothetical protein
MQKNSLLVINPTRYKLLLIIKYERSLTAVTHGLIAMN